MLIGIVVAVIAVVLVAGWAIDRADRRGTGRSRKSSEMTQGAMRHRQTYGRKAGR